MKKWIVSLMRLMLILCLIPGAFAQEVQPVDVVTADTRLGILSNMLPEQAVTFARGQLEGGGRHQNAGRDDARTDAVGKVNAAELGSRGRAV